MIRAIFETESGKQVVLLGLDAENIKRLLEDQPIVVNLRHLNPNGPPTDLPDIDVAVAWLRDAEHLKQMLADRGIDLIERTTP